MKPKPHSQFLLYVGAILFCMASLMWLLPTDDPYRNRTTTITHPDGSTSVQTASVFTSLPRQSTLLEQVQSFITIQFLIGGVLLIIMAIKRRLPSRQKRKKTKRHTRHQTCQQCGYTLYEARLSTVMAIRCPECGTLNRRSNLATALDGRNSG